MVRFPTPLRLAPRRPGRSRSGRVAVGLFAAVVLVACGTPSSGEASGDSAAGGDSGGLRVAASTAVLGEFTRAVLGDRGEVTVLVEDGQDPHTTELSAREVAELHDVDLLVVNGLGLEANLGDVVAEVEAAGVPVVEVGPALDPREIGSDQHADDEHGDDEHAEDEHADEEHADDEHAEDEHADDERASEEGHGAESDEPAGAGHEHGPLDPHVWLDVARMVEAPHVIADALAKVADGPWDDAAERFGEELRALDEEVAATLDDIPSACRRVATNHDVLGTFAERYGIEVPVTVIAGTSTDADPSAGDFASGIQTVRDSGISVVVVEDTSSPRLAEAFAADAGIDVLRLPLAGPPPDGPGSAGYADMMRTIANGLADALASCGDAAE